MSTAAHSTECQLVEAAIRHAAEANRDMVIADVDIAMQTACRRASLLTRKHVMKRDTLLAAAALRHQKATDAAREHRGRFLARPGGARAGGVVSVDPAVMHHAHRASRA